jgi:methionyl-tRNA formyltransferase/L-amino acid N-acyltransferase YncA
MRIMLFGDIPGIPQLLNHLPAENIVGIVVASIRPEYHVELYNLAVQLKIPYIVQPKRECLEYNEFKEMVRRLQPDLIWVNSYSMIIHEDVLALPRLGGINIHSALLPRNRGCNPIQWAILNEDYITGVTIHEMTSRLDQGPIIDQCAVPIFFDDTWIHVRDRLMVSADNLIKLNLEKILSGSWTATLQTESLATAGRRRIPEDGYFNWSEPVVDIYNKIRALLPPLPPAFYRDAANQKHELKHYQTIWQVASQKYALEVGGGHMQSERVRLRPLKKSDSAILHEWINNRDLVILNASYYPVSENDHGVWVERMMTSRSDLIFFIIEEVTSGKTIGICQLLNINWRHRSAELQIRIGAPDFLGRGFGSEATRLLLRFGFMDLNLHRIYLHVFATNNRAVRAYKKCGFVQEGILKEAAFIDGMYCDVYVMGLLKTYE